MSLSPSGRSVVYHLQSILAFFVLSQVIEFIQGLPGCKEQVHTFKEEVTISTSRRTTVIMCSKQLDLQFSRRNNSLPLILQLD